MLTECTDTLPRLAWECLAFVQSDDTINFCGLIVRVETLRDQFHRHYSFRMFLSLLLILLLLSLLLRLAVAMVGTDRSKHQENNYFVFLLNFVSVSSRFFFPFPLIHSRLCKIPMRGKLEMHKYSTKVSVNKLISTCILKN